jgi:hypothetical protein
MAAAIQLNPRVQAERPRELFAVDYVNGRLHIKDVAADGSKFLLVLTPRDKPQAPRLVITKNWHLRF